MLSSYQDNNLGSPYVSDRIFGQDNTWESVDRVVRAACVTLVEGAKIHRSFCRSHTVNITLSAIELNTYVLNSRDNFDPYKKSKLEKMKRAFYQSQLFDSIEIHRLFKFHIFLNISD